MNRIVIRAALLIGAAAAVTLVHGYAHAQAPAALTSHVPVPATTEHPLDAAFEAANRGDLGPLERAAGHAQGDEALLVRARLAAARGETRADPALARLAAARDPVIRQAALSILTGAAFAGADYAAAGRWGRALAETQRARGHDEDAAATGHVWQLADLLVGRPPQAVEGAITERFIPARVDRVGLPRIDFAVNGQAQEAVFDTGANLSVLSADTARRMGVTMLEGAAAVGNGVQGTVGVRIGVADRVEIAGTIIRNVPFLIIADADLTFPVPGGYDIKAIIGLPVMRALGRVRVESAAGRFIVLPPEEAQPRAPNMVTSGSDLYVAVTIAGEAVPLHLDTGANQSSLSALYAEGHVEAVAMLATRQAGTASAGGAAMRQVATWRDVPLSIAGRALVLPTLPVALPRAEGPRPTRYGVLGSNALRAFESYTLDFRAMRLDLGELVRAAAAQ